MVQLRSDKRGSCNHNAKLDLSKVRAILSSNKTNIALARELGVSPAAVSNVRTGRTWGWIDEGLDFESGGQLGESP